MLAAGGAIDPFWAMYAQHKTAEVHKILETYRIGDLVSTCLCIAIDHFYYALVGDRFETRLLSAWLQHVLTQIMSVRLNLAQGSRMQCITQHA